jgi:hypothetical protein
LVSKTNYSLKLYLVIVGIISWFNKHCLDISKSFVNCAYKACSGIDLNVNPLKYQGNYVEKSNRNASHDGRILNSPISELKNGMVYMKLVDSTVNHCNNELMVEDLRVVIINGFFPLVFRKYRSASVRFSNRNSKVELSTFENEFNNNEQQMILKFCNKISLDYGELDVIRDRESHIAYIIDANKTPQGQNGISESDDKLSSKIMSEVFRQVVEGVIF